MTSTENAVYPFEGLLPSLEGPPIAARRALDLAGVRLSIEGWRSLAIEDRHRLALAGAAEVIDTERVYAAVRRASPPAQRAPQGQDPDPTSPPEALVRALEPNRAIDPRRWQRLRGLDRYAIMHTYRRAVARSSFMILGEAFDAILALSASAPLPAVASPRPGPLAASASPQLAPASSRGAQSSPSPGSYRAPGAYSNVKTYPPAGSQGDPSNVPTWAPPPGPPSPQPQRKQAEDGGYQASRRAITAPMPVNADDDEVSSHLSAAGEVHMVDVGDKPQTERRAVASAVVVMRPETAQKIARREAPKGEVLATARIAGIMAAKRTPDLIPLCHAIALTKVTVDLEVDVPGARVVITATAEAFDRTGVEMEAMMAASVAALTIYDMLKGTDREMVVSEVKLLEKSGGRTGHFQRRDGRP